MINKPASQPVSLAKQSAADISQPCMLLQQVHGAVLLDREQTAMWTGVGWLRVTYPGVLSVGAVKAVMLQLA